jgi:hypothetical protein
VSVRNDSVKTNLMQVRRLKLKHLKNSTAVDLICSLLDFIILAMGATELCRN